MVLFPIERAHDVAAMYRELVATGPDEAAFLAMYFTVAEPAPDYPPEIAGRPAVGIAVGWCGAIEDGERFVEPVRKRAVLDTFSPKEYLDLQAMNDEPMAWGHRFYMKGALLPDLADGFVEAAAGSVGAPPGACEISLWAFGGATARAPEDAMAFTGRDAAFWCGVESLWDDPSRDGEMIGWSRSTMDSITPFTTAGHYVNDMVETGTDVTRSVYGDAKYDRLVALKRAWDPDNVFRLNQNVRP